MKHYHKIDIPREIGNRTRRHTKCAICVASCVEVSWVICLNARSLVYTNFECLNVYNIFTRRIAKLHILILFTNYLYIISQVTFNDKIINMNDARVTRNLFYRFDCTIFSRYRNIIYIMAGLRIFDILIEDNRKNF